ncbi:S8 family serine peptidase [Rhodobacterales bacterium HKCCE2091]|nr:S8 family serine peptidase [Rhodobacterales bacterium HKCCE2091]
MSYLKPKILALAVLAGLMALPHLAAAQGVPGNSNNTRVTTVDRDEPREPMRGRDRVTAPSGRAEVVVMSPPGQSQAVIDTLSAAGAQLVRYRDYPNLSRRGHFFDFPRGLDVDEARLLLAGPAPGAVVSIHVIYRYAQGGPRVYAAELVGITNISACRAGGAVVGIIDGPVNPGHPALAGASVRVESVLSDGDSPVGPDHGTAVAALIAGQDGSGALAGFAGGARLFAVTAFARENGDEGADTERVTAALDRLIGQGVRLVNMSFAGPPNAVMEDILSAAAGRGAVMIAAAGNDGQRFAAYPAGSPNVIAVTAVDAGLNLYRRANTGSHIEFAAPGVDVFVASSGGGRYQSGTSYAAPIVTAIAARLAPGGSLSTVRARLQSASQDLGNPGRDGQFGWGLVHAPGC